MERSVNPDLSGNQKQFATKSQRYYFFLRALVSCPEEIPGRGWQDEKSFAEYIDLSQRHSNDAVIIALIHNSIRIRFHERERS